MGFRMGSRDRCRRILQLQLREKGDDDNIAQAGGALAYFGRGPRSVSAQTPFRGLTPAADFRSSRNTAFGTLKVTVGSNAPVVVCCRDNVQFSVYDNDICPVMPGTDQLSTILISTGSTLTPSFSSHRIEASMSACLPSNSRHTIPISSVTLAWRMFVTSPNRLPISQTSAF